MPGHSDYHHFVNASGLLSFHHGLGSLVVRISGFGASIVQFDVRTIVVIYDDGEASHNHAEIAGRTRDLPSEVEFGAFVPHFCLVNDAPDWIVFDARQDGASAMVDGWEALFLRLSLGRLVLEAAPVAGVPEVKGRHLTAIRFSPFARP